jgi:hypothetical protein
VGGWGVPVDEQSTAAPAAWGTPVDEDSGTVQPAIPQPASPVQSPPNMGMMDYAKMGWNALTQPEATGTRPGVIGQAATAIHNVGGRALNVVGQAIPQAAQALSDAGQHPLDTLMKTTPMGMASDAANAVASRVGEFQNTAKMDLPLAAENVAGDALGAYAGSKLVEAAKPAVAAAGDVAGRAKQFIRPATSEGVVPAPQQAAAGLAKAINPPGGIPEGLEDSLANQTPGIKDYAARTSNPLNTRWELAKAALGHAQELNDFYDQHVLGPSADRPVSIEGTGYQGESNGNGKATLGQIDDRLSAINKLTKPAYNNINSGATMTALERMGLDNEAGALRSTLYNELANDTGMTPDAVKKLRTDYGQSYDIASKTDAARRRVGVGGPIPLTKEGLIQSVLENVVGGRDAIADRGVQSALQQFKPAMSPIADMRQNVTGFRIQAANTAAANQAAAQQEVAHGVGLGQDAQAAAAQRGQQASGIRGQNNAQALSAAQQEVLHAHDLQTTAQDAAAQRAGQASTARAGAVQAGGQFTQTTEPTAGTFSSPNVPKGLTRYSGGKAYALDPKSGWWVPQ